MQHWEAKQLRFLNLWAVGLWLALVFTDRGFWPPSRRSVSFTAGLFVVFMRKAGWFMQCKCWGQGGVLLIGSSKLSYHGPSRLFALCTSGVHKSLAFRGRAGHLYQKFTGLIPDSLKFSCWSCWARYWTINCFWESFTCMWICEYESLLCRLPCCKKLLNVSVSVYEWVNSGFCCKTLQVSVFDILPDSIGSVQLGGASPRKRLAM